MTTSSRASLNGRTFETRNDPIEVTSSLPYADPAWRGPCANGHEVTQETKVYRVDGSTWCDICQEMEEEGHYECPTCGVEVTPGTTFDMYRRFIPGLTEYFIDGRSVDKETFLRELSEEQHRRTT